ncbi:MAG TPA: type II secretion system protein, partial [Usitatibacter sp.]|nr:type II secretion system protein [Usitatibacter sp.]
MRKARGFTLIEIVVVIAIMGFLVAMGAMAARAISASQKRSLTTTRMSSVDTALLQFVMVQKRLPCPADGTQSSA